MYYTQWMTAFEKNPTSVKQITWISGPEYVFVEDVVESIKRVVHPEAWNFFPFVAGQDSEREIWNEIEQVPGDRTPRLVIVRNAERLAHPERLQQFVTHRGENPFTYLIFVSRDNDLPRLTPGADNKYGKGELVPYLAALTGKGHVIECKPVTAATAQKAVTWVQNKAGVKKQIAEYLLARANVNMRLVRDICAKIRVFDGEPTINVVNLMLSEQPRDDFADALLALDKKTALLALAKIQPGDYLGTIGMLDSRLDFAGMLHDMQIEQRTNAEMVKAAGRQSFLVKDILPIAKHYNSKRRLQIRNTLAMADEALREGIRIGPMEAIVALW